MTYRYVVYDLQKNFNATFDDADFTFNQILYWVMVVANRLRVQQTMATNSDLFTSTFDFRPVLKSSTTTTSCPSFKSRRVRLEPINPAPPVTATFDMGVILRVIKK